MIPSLLDTVQHPCLYAWDPRLPISLLVDNIYFVLPLFTATAILVNSRSVAPNVAVISILLPAWRWLLIEVANSISIYGSKIWAGTLDVQKRTNALVSIQITTALRIHCENTISKWQEWWNDVNRGRWTAKI